jgi:uncharacterized protein involved in outer membrane biogenesis
MPLPSRQQVVNLLGERARRHRRLLKGFGIFLVAVALLGFLVAPPIVRSVAESQLTKLLHRPVTVADVDINPFALSATVTGFSVAEPEGDKEALGFDRLYVNLEAQSLFRGGPVLREVQLAVPRLKLRREKGGRYNWQDLIDEFLAKPPSEEKAVFAANNIQVSGGQIEFDDQAEGVVQRITDLQIGVPFISSIPSQVEIFVQPVVNATVNGRPFGLTGQTQPFSEDRESTLEIKLDGLDLPGYLAYLPFEPAFKLPGAKLYTDLVVSFKQPAGGDALLGLRGTAALGEVELQDKAGAPVAKLARLDVDVADADLTGRKFHLNRVRLDSPQIEVRRAADGALNLLALLAMPAAPASATPAAPAAPGKAVTWQVDRVELVGGGVVLADASVQPVFATRFQEIQVEVDKLASAGEPARIKLSMVSDAGEKIEHTGTLRPAPLEASGELKLTGLVVPRYAPYAAAALPGGQFDSGKLDATVGYTLSAGEQGTAVKLSLPGATLSDLAVRLKDGKEPLVKLARVELTDGKLDPAARSLTLGRVAVERPQLAVVRDKGGRFDAQGLVGGDGKPAEPAKPASSAPAASAAKSGPTWTVGVAELAVQGGSLRMEDRTQERPIVLLAEDLGIKVQDFSTAPGAKARVAVDGRINQKGRLAVKGNLTLAPLATELDLDLQGIDLLPASPYLAEYLYFALSRGSLSTHGKLALELPPGGEPKGRFTGDVRFQDFATIDKLNAGDFVKWKSFGFEQVDLRLAPFALSIKEVALTDFYTRLILNEKGELNLREVTFRQKQEEVAAAAGKAPPQAAQAPVAAAPAAGKAQTTVAPPPAKIPPIRIDRIVLKGGNIAYSDRFIKPNYDANLTGMGGTLVGLSSDPATVAELDLAGKVDNAAPVTVAGKLNPFRQDRYLDIRAEVRGFDLPALSSYSGKYVGYGIEKGKLSATLSYKVEDRKLTATNKIFLDQLTFGDKVESPDALKLPVLLAVSLLKNSRGEIDIDLPISGSLDDPEFSVGGIVFKAIMNLLVRAVTAPFSLLGSLFSGGEDLSYIEFNPGQATLTPPAIEKLQGMAKALADRPALEVELAGRVDPVADLDGLKHEAIRQQMAAFKIKDQLKKGEAPPSLDDVVIDPAEYPALLKRVYKEGDFKKPRNLIGLAKDVPDSEMEALLLKNIEVDDDDLRNLGRRRGQQVENWLLENGKVSPDRLFVLSPRIGEDGKETKAKTSRVDFALK